MASKMLYVSSFTLFVSYGIIITDIMSVHKMTCFITGLFLHFATVCFLLLLEMLFSVTAWDVFVGSLHLLEALMLFLA